MTDHEKVNENPVVVISVLLPWNRWLSLFHVRLREAMSKIKHPHCTLLSCVDISEAQITCGGKNKTHLRLTNNEKDFLLE